MSGRAARLRHLPFAVAIVLALGHVGLLSNAAMHHTGGHFSYPIDDAFIHLALAKHIAFDGVYGVTRHAFSASSSSVIWPWLLAACMRVFGDHVTLPLFLNMAAAVALLWVVARGLEREAPGLSIGARTAVLVGVVLLVPVATLIMIGMEHVLHAALTVAFVLEAARVIAAPPAKGAPSKRPWPLFVLACALLATRYEGLFPVGIAVALLAARKRFGVAASLAAAGAAPVVLFGLYSMAHGSLFLPNSIALKRQHLKLEDVSDLGDIFGGNILHTITLQAYLLPLLLGTFLFFVRELRRSGPWTKNATRLLLALGTTVAHVELASLGWFFRYEAYLVALDVTVVAIALAAEVESFSFRAELRRSRVVFAFAALTAFVATAPLWVRGLAALGNTPVACRNIYEQQVQSARFFARYFPHDKIALNDIGAVAYYGDQPMVDLVGLASLDVAKAKSLQIDKALSPAQIAAFTKDVPVAIVYDEWFEHVPTSWVRVGRLRIDVNKVCASNSVSIFATAGEHVPRVITALREFAASVPPSVRREGIWAEAPPGEPWRADAGDTLYVDVPAAPESSMAYPVLKDGTILVPKVGEVRVRGLTLDEVNAAARAKAAETPPEKGAPRVRLVAQRGCRIIVAGDVLNPFDDRLECGTTAARALALAGAHATKASYVWRQEAPTFNQIAISDDNAAKAIALRGGDIIIVP